MNAFEGGLYSGTLYAEFFVNGRGIGLKKAGNATKFELKPEAEVKNLPSKMKETYGQNLRTVVLAKPHTLSITVNDPEREVWKIGFMGELETIAIDPGTVTDEVHAAPDPGNALDLAYRDISSVVVTRKNGEDASTWTATSAIAAGNFVVPTVANQHFYKCTVAGNTDATEPVSWPTDGSTVTDGAVTWQNMGPIEALLNTDYTIGVDGASRGWITLSDATRIEAEELLAHDYSYAARAGYKIKAAKVPSAKVRWILDGENLETGDPVWIEVFETLTMATSPVDFLSDDWQSLELSATPITPDGMDHPYVIDKSKPVV